MARARSETEADNAAYKRKATQAQRAELRRNRQRTHARTQNSSQAQAHRDPAKRTAQGRQALTQGTLRRQRPCKHAGAPPRHGNADAANAGAHDRRTRKRPKLFGKPCCSRRSCRRGRSSDVVIELRSTRMRRNRNGYTLQRKTHNERTAGSSAPSAPW